MQLHSALGLVQLQETELTLGTSGKRGCIIQQLLMEFKRGRTAEPHGEFDLETEKSSELHSFSLGLHSLSPTFFCFPCLVQPLPVDRLSLHAITCMVLNSCHGFSFNRTLQL